VVFVDLWWCCWGTLWWFRGWRGFGARCGASSVVVMQVDFVACFGLFLFELVRFALLFQLFYVFEFGIGIMVGQVWTGLGVCSGGS